MVTEIRLYFEGNAALKPGFHQFFESIYSLTKKTECRMELISCGADWAKDFRNALKRHPSALNLLLIDSERPLTRNLAAELCAKNNWGESQAESIFWMVEAMESWFHADKKALKEYYGSDGFNTNALAPNPSVEQIPKKDLLDGLKNATRNTSKGKYHKTAHAPKLLGSIDPKKVCQAAGNCERLFTALKEALS